MDKQPIKSKDCLREDYANATLATQLELEINRLELLTSTLSLKRPIQSLRTNSLFSGLPLNQARALIQEVETKANLRAIENKKQEIKILQKQLSVLKQTPHDPGLAKNERLLCIQKKKIKKKIAFLSECDNTVNREWRKKNVKTSNLNQYNSTISSKKFKKKTKAKERKLRRKERMIQERAVHALENNLVINLSDVDVPAYSIAVLSYGPGWIPTPSFDNTQFKIDGYNVGNKLGWKTVFKGSEKEEVIPPSLQKKPITTPCLNVKDSVIREVKDSITNFVENLKPKKLSTNMNKFEQEGYNWLVKNISQGNIAITSADKGGAIIVTTPQVIREITEAKLNDPTRYRKIQCDPTPVLQERLENVWVEGHRKEFVTAEQAKKTIGLIIKETGRITKSTSDITKPGIPYGYPLFKVHKLSAKELVEKKIPPTRFVTDLSTGVTARSDKFLVWKWLGDLTKDYAGDLVKDTTDALRKLEEIGRSGVVSHNNIFSFNLDVVSLYDSLSHDLVMDALDDAIETCRPDWTHDFIDWFKGMIKLSFDSAVVKFGEDWYEAVDGVPTGGVNSVDAGNIAVFFVLKDLIYNSNVRPDDLPELFRFVDDGTGLWLGLLDSLEKWLSEIRRKSVAKYNLDITYEIKPIIENTQFLDIWYKFIHGRLSTDIYRKPTDANRYLEFSSHHPRHTFHSIVFSQAMRYCRVINDKDILDLRLKELKQFFIQSSYPEKLVEEAIGKAREQPRSLDYNHNQKANTPMTPWVMTYGPGYEETRGMVPKLNNLVENSNSW